MVTQHEPENLLDNTESTPAVEIVKIMLLQRLNDLYDSIELYNKEISLGISSNKLPLVKSRLLTLFISLQPTIKRQKSSTDYDSLLKKARSPTNIDDILEVTFTLNEILDSLKVTRIDFKEKHKERRILRRIRRKDEK